MKLLLFSALLAITQLQVFGLGDDYCFGKDTERTQTRHFTTKTAYQIIKGTHIEKQYLVAGCVAQKIWILHRHGTRLPSKSTIQKVPRLEQLRDEIVKNYRVRRTKPTEGALCLEDLSALQMWKWNNSITPDQENYLTSQGYDDMRGTAKLYQKLYPDIMTREYNSSSYLFRHSETQRTTESFKAFAEGLFGANNNAQAEPIPPQDMLLRPYDYCDAWNALDYSGPDTENAKFRRSNLWNNTIVDISTRLGFLYALESTDVELMLDMCRYEQAWQVDRTSVWCSIFLPDQVTIFEYEDDMKYYYKSGYGNEINERVNCRLVQDMLNHLNSPALPNTIVNIAHSNALQTFITALGINKDDIKLTATNYNELTDRRWKTSNMDPFAANFVAAKYQCDNDPLDKQKVVFFLNQNAVELDWCQVGLCNWSEVMKKYDKFYKANCDTSYCGEGGAPSLGVSIVSLLIAAIVYLIY